MEHRLNIARQDHDDHDNDDHDCDDDGGDDDDDDNNNDDRGMQDQHCNALPGKLFFDYFFCNRNVFLIKLTKMLMLMMG